MSTTYLVTVGAFETTCLPMLFRWLTPTEIGMCLFRVTAERFVKIIGILIFGNLSFVGAHQVLEDRLSRGLLMKISNIHLVA
jgi:hypothetical protein